MVEDPKWELAILATVQGFYERLLQESIGGEVPVPQGLEAISLQQDEGDVHQTLDRMRRWLRLLDLSITPAMLRRAFTPDTDAEIAEAMLRYFVRKRDLTAVTRDKTDLVATFLYRHPRVAGQWEQRGYGLDGLPLAPFEIALIEILADADLPMLPEEHVQLLRRFDPLEEEAEKFRDFNALMEAGIITRVRELKQYLDSSFYHPSVLATIAPYNATFGKKFDELFSAAAAEISGFAQALAEQGGNILGNVDGFDVTVEHIEALDRDALLKSDYTTALEKFQRVSKLKRTLDRRPPIRRTAKLVPSAAVMPTRSTGGAAAAARPALAKPARVPRVVATAATPQQLTMEETKLQRVEESVRVFVRVADPKFRQVVPMRFFNLTLTPEEADAFCADYLDEKSARADLARNQMRIVATIARMSTEIEELKRSHNSPSLWKLHADSLVVLLEVARRTNESALQVLAGIASPADATPLQASLQKLRDRSELVAKVLARAQAENDPS